jgi:hypothetical protein
MHKMHVKSAAALVQLLSHSDAAAPQPHVPSSAAAELRA